MAFGALLSGALGGLAKGAAGTAGAIGGAASTLLSGAAKSTGFSPFDESGNFSLKKLLEDSEFSVRTPKFSLRLGDKNKRMKDALMKRVEEMTLGKTDSITTSALDVGNEFDPASGMTSVFQPNPFQAAQKTMFGGPQRLRMM